MSAKPHKPETPSAEKLTAAVAQQGPDNRRLRFEHLETRRLLASDFDNTPSSYPTTPEENGESAAAEIDTAFYTATLDAALITDNFGNQLDGDGDGTAGQNFRHVLLVAKKGDSDVDGDVDLSDYTTLASNFDPGGLYAPYTWCDADFEADGDIDLTDYNLVAATFSPGGYAGTTPAGYEPPCAVGEPPGEVPPVFGGKNVISNTADGAFSVFATDVDGDNDIDALSASFDDNTIAWHENNGDDSFTEHTINTAAQGAFSVYAADIDGDSDIDVLSASYNDNTIAWYENDGNQSFTTHTIATDTDGAVSVFAVDVDSDGDMDVLSASYGRDEIAWHENDGNQNFTTHSISSDADGARDIVAVDIDGDGDMDVLSASVADDTIAWHENDGNEIFTTRTISTDAKGAYRVLAEDVDGDGDMDVLSASRTDDKIAWYENDGNENFTTRTISTAADGARGVFATDVDGDGDMDVLSASYHDDKIAWYENDGSENFVEHTISTAADGARSVFAADMNGDGVIDVLSASESDDTIAWYENVNALATSPPQITSVLRNGGNNTFGSFNTLTFTFSEAVQLNAAALTLRNETAGGTVLDLTGAGFEYRPDTFTATWNLDGPTSPTLDLLSDLQINEDDPQQTILLTGISDGEEGTQPLRVTATSSRTALIPHPTVSYTSADSSGSLALTPEAEQSGAATITVTVEDGGTDNNLDTPGDNDTFSRTFTVTVQPVNDTPTLDTIANLTIDEDASQQTVNLTGLAAGGSESQPLKLTASSNNTAVIPHPAVAYVSPAAMGNLTFTPEPNQSGTATVTVSVEDGGPDKNLNTPGDNATLSRTFDVTVQPVNDTPTLDAIANLTIDEDASQQTVNLTGIAAGGNESQSLRLTASSSDPTVIPHPVVAYVSPATTGSLTFTPHTNQNGVVTMTVTVEDGGLDNNLDTPADNGTRSRTFDVTVIPETANHAPVNTVPETQQTVLNTPLAFTAYRENQISISDPDAGNLEVKMTLTANNGLVSLVNRNLVSTGLTYLVGDGLEDTTVTIRGKIAEINTALSWVAFTPTAGYIGNQGQITINTNDLGNIGSGGPQSDTDVVSIIVVSQDNGFSPSPSWPTFPGALDTTFDDDGRRILDPGGSDGSDYIDQMILLPDGKIVAAGAVDGELALLRFTDSLDLDPNFGSGGVVKTGWSLTSGGTQYLPGVMLEVDKQGRLLVAGNRRIYRYLANGSLDTTFGSSGTVELGFYWDAWYIHGLGVQGDGRIVIASSANGGIWRMDQDGANATRIIDGDWKGIQVWEDGDIVAADLDFDIHRYSRDAVHEETYDTIFGETNSVLALPDNRLLLVGKSDAGDLVVSRHLANGALDTTFGSMGRTELPVLEGEDLGYRATLQADGKILIVGSTHTGDNWDIAVARLSYDGAPDTSLTGYDNATVSLRVSETGDDYGYAILALPDGKILVAGRAEDHIALARLLGATDQSDATANQAPVNTVPDTQQTVLNTPLAFTAYRENQISISDPDAGNLEVEMTLTANNGLVSLVNRNLVSTGLTYLAGDGLEDTTITVRGKIAEINTALSWVAFTPTAGYIGSAAWITINTNDLGNLGSGGAQSDADVVSITVVSQDNGFSPSPSWPTFPGALDTTFDDDGRRILDPGGSDGSDYIDQMILLPDGKIVAAGAVDGELALLRFTDSLDLDPNFGSGGVVKTGWSLTSGGTQYLPGVMLEVDKQGRLLVAGNRRIYRYLANGSLDTTFGSSGTVELGFYWDAWYIHGLGVQGDGRIVIASSANGGIWRMDQDGANATRIIDGDWKGIQVWEDGDIVAADLDFDIHRYSRDAVHEETYDTIFGETNSVLALPDNRLLLVGKSDAGDLVVSRHLANGALDTTFGSMGRTELPVLEGEDLGYRATLQADGKILIVGSTHTGDNWDIAVARLSYDGAPDTSLTGYDNATVSLRVSETGDDYGYAILALPDGKILVAGRAEDHIALARLLGDSDHLGVGASQSGEPAAVGYFHHVPRAVRQAGDVPDVGPTVTSRQQSATRDALATAFAHYESDRRAFGTGATSLIDFQSLDLSLAGPPQQREIDRVAGLFAEPGDR